MKRNLIFEIGTEEIPARFFNAAVKDLKNIISKALSDNKLSYESVKVFATPRRLAVKINTLDEKQKDETQEYFGPSKNIAYDENGNLSKAGAGFLRSKGLNEEDVFIKKTDKGEYLAAVKNIIGKKTSDVLKEILPSVIQTLNFPKNMVWNESKFSFARPIRWILAVFGSEVIDFSFNGVSSNDYTYAHRLIKPTNRFKVSNPDEYEEILRNNWVEPDYNKRKNLIRESLENISKELNLKVLVEEELLNTVNFLVEKPTPIICTFPKKYLKLPNEIIVKSMCEHQKYFPVFDNNSKLTEKFIVIANGDPKYSEIFKEGNERVLNARLEDAEFYFKEDTKKGFEKYVDNLRNITYVESLGSYYLKMERLEKISIFIGNIIRLDRNQMEYLKRAAFLCKADLATNMLGEKEFTSLQGMIGYCYALESGEKNVIAEGIKEHYKPVSFEDSLPDSIIGQILSIADKMDNIVSTIGLGNLPSGSQDPFALRRQINGIFRIIYENQLMINIKELTDYVLTQYDGKFKNDFNDIKHNLYTFINQRIKFYFKNKDYRYDLLDAVLACGLEEALDIPEKYEALVKISEHENFLPIVLAYKRVNNITKNINHLMPIYEDLFEQKEEKRLYESYRAAHKKVLHLSALKDFDSALKELLNMKDDIDSFFDNVMVMAKDSKLKENRLALLTHIKGLFREYADFSFVVVEKK